LLPESPARAAGNPANPGSSGDACAGDDARGANRNTVAPRCDIGAYQYYADFNIDTTADLPDSVPGERLAEGPKCGHCHKPLLPALPVAISGQDLPRFAAATELPVVADFWAEWCGPCKMMAPAFADAARQRPNVQFVKVDTEASPEAATQFGIRGIPTMVLFRGGAEAARVSGAMASAQLLGWIDQQLR
jgi:thioredoxin 2